MNIDFNQWWDEDDLTTQGNPFTDGTPAFWAWEGWCAGVKAEREACAKVCDDLPAPDYVPPDDVTVWDVATLDCGDAIRARSNT